MNPIKIHWPIKNNNSIGKIRLLEALSATGLRSIRYYNEILHLDEIIVNDIDKEAVNTIKKN